MEKYDLSIIIPFYYGNDKLPKLLSSLKKAIECTKQIKVEIIIVNDSPECQIDKTKFETLNLRVITNKKNVGIHRARVNGIINAKGKYIFMIDQDDLVKENVIKSQFLKIKDNDMIISNGFDENPLNYGKIYHSKKHQLKCLEKKYYLNIGCMIVSPGQCIIKKQAIPKEWLEYQVVNNGADDLLLWMMMLEKKKKIAINEEPLYIHTYSGENVSCDFDKMEQSALEVINYLYHNKFVKDKEKNKFIKRLKMRKYYEGKSKFKKLIALIFFPTITYYLIKMKLE